MFLSVGNILPSLYPVIALFSALFSKDTDGDDPDNGDSDSDEGQPNEQDDGDDDETDSDEEDDDSDDDDDDSDEDDSDDSDEDEDFEEDDESRTGKHADRAISKKDAQEVVPALQTIVKMMVKYPDTAEDTLAELRSEQPHLAERLAKMYESGKNKDLNEALKDAPDGLRDLLSALVEDMSDLKKRREEEDERAQQNQIAEERRLYKEWEGEKHPYLNPKSEEAQTPIGKKLIKEFRSAVNRLPTDEPVTEDLLEDALSIAIRRSGWDNATVSAQAKKQAKEQAQKAREGAAGTGKSRKGKGGESKREPSRITGMWPTQSDERQKKVDEVKARKFPNQ